MYYSQRAVFSAEPEVDPGDMQVGRRAAKRLTVDLPAHFKVGGVTCVVLVRDISPTGACLQLSSPPARGTKGTLTWEGIECPCEVVWSKTDSCGIEFLAS